MHAVILDTGVLSLVTDKPGKSTTVTAVQNWFTELLSAGTRIYVPEICDYELRRELIRSNKTSSIERLDLLVSNAGYLAITTLTMRRAAELWAIARNSGKPTADDSSLDGDIILCALVESLGLLESEYVVATTNVRHLTLFVRAAEWRSITS